MVKNKKITYSIIAVAVIAIGWLIFGGKKKQAVITYEETEVAADTIRNSVTATGTIEAVTEVEVGTQVSGIVSKLYVDYNSVVKKGQVIAELDKTNLVSTLSSAKANLSSAQSDLRYQESNYNRNKRLFEKGLISQDDFETAELSYKKSLEQVKVNKENVKKAETDLGYATITSPIDGVVLSKSVEEGQTVAASFSTPTLFTIAKDLTDMRVIANVDEADIANVANGQRVSFTVDAYPDDTFSGTVTQVRQEATTTSNVTTYEVVIAAPNADLKLKPGLTANVTIHTLDRPGVLSVKSKALRFSPTQELVGKETKIIDCNGKNKLWTKEGNKLVAHAVTIGITDGIRTEIKSGINPNTKVVLSISDANPEQAEEKPENNNPFMPKRPGGNKKK
ncbi:MAG: efflux RND transporter periplasmic adaptor subunit [Bacteroidaceae bacterium]|nr:efflux RND transporter periplasmic adaptor subunit [Bacteroidaceae bacterium]